MKVINPANNELIKEYKEHTSSEVTDKFQKAEAAFQAWKKTSFANRTELMKNAAAILRKRSEEYAELMTLEMGKLLRSGEAEPEKCAWVCDYYEQNDRLDRLKTNSL